jgi:hypothetical protein
LDDRSPKQNEDGFNLNSSQPVLMCTSPHSPRPLHQHSLSSTCVPVQSTLQTNHSSPPHLPTNVADDDDEEEEEEEKQEQVVVNNGDTTQYRKVSCLILANWSDIRCCPQDFDTPKDTEE